MTDFDVYLESLARSWESLAVPHDDATVIRDPRYMASISLSYPVLNNAILFDPLAVADVKDAFANAGDYAIWSHQFATARALERAGFLPDERTHAMVLHLELLDAPSSSLRRVVTRVAVASVAALNGVDANLLEGVPGIRAYATKEGDSGAILIEAAHDVNVSFVATRPESRRRGLAGEVLKFALREARGDGFRTSSLQATAMAAGVYRRLGYVDVATWQEWRAAPSPASPDRA